MDLPRILWTIAEALESLGADGANEIGEAAGVLDDFGIKDIDELKEVLNRAPLEEALEEFIDAIEVTGGMMANRKGYHVPVGDQDWIDLGGAYMTACEALGREPKVAEED